MEHYFEITPSTICIIVFHVVTSFTQHEIDRFIEHEKYSEESYDYEVEGAKTKFDRIEIDYISFIGKDKPIDYSVKINSLQFRTFNKEVESLSKYIPDNPSTLKEVSLYYYQ